MLAGAGLFPQNFVEQVELWSAINAEARASSRTGRPAPKLGAALYGWGRRLLLLLGAMTSCFKHFLIGTVPTVPSLVVGSREEHRGTHRETRTETHADTHTGGQREERREATSTSSVQDIYNRHTHKVYIQITHAIVTYMIIKTEQMSLKRRKR